MSKYICLCSQISEKNFCKFINNNHSMSLEKVYAEMNIGNTCSACRLKLEITYIKEINNALKIDKKNSKKTFNFKNKLFKFIKFFDNYLSIKPVVQNLVAPIFYGNNISTKLIISNIIPDTFQSYAATFSVYIKIRDAKGKVISKLNRKLNKNNRLVIPLSADQNTEIDNINAYGSVWIKIRPSSSGYIGFTRPHIRISNDHFNSSIHLQNGKKSNVYINSVFKDDERQYFSLVNMESKETEIQIFLNKKNSFNKVLKPYEAILLQIGKNISKNNLQNIDIELRHDGIIRRNFLVENISSRAISIDHI